MAGHCTNHYTRSVCHLEGVLEERLAQLTLLVQENSALKRREAALQSAIGSLAGSVSAATRAVLVSAMGGCCSAPRPDTPNVPATGATCLAAACSSITDGQGFLLSMQQREAAVQRIMEQLGCVDYDDLYSTWLLRRAFSSPLRAAAYLVMPKTERMQYVLATVQKLGLLVGKYDLLHHPSTSLGTPREQVDALVDDLNERTLAFCLLAPPHRQLEITCLNMETGLPEPYPQGWWAVVVDAMQLTNDQKAALKICWDKVKPIKLAFTAQYELLSAHLVELQKRQLDQQRQFERQAEHAMDAALHLKAARMQQKQELEQERKAQQAAQWRQQQQQMAGEGLGDSEYELMEFCQAFLRSEPVEQQQNRGANGAGPSAAAAATAPSAAGVPAAEAAGANGVLAADGQAAAAQLPASQAPLLLPLQCQQHQLYAARMAPVQQPLQQQHFLQFSPAVAAAASTSDQSLWLQGLMTMPGFYPAAAAAGAGVNPAVAAAAAAAAAAVAAVQQPAGLQASAVKTEGMMGNPAAEVVAAARAPSFSSATGPTDSSAWQQSPSQQRSSGGMQSGAAAAGGAAGQTSSGGGNEQQRSPVHDVLNQPQTQQHDLLLGLFDREQQEVQQQLDRITAQLKMQQYCMHTYVLNICSKKQMALKYVYCYPWFPESFSMCEALDEMGW